MKGANCVIEVKHLTKRYGTHTAVSDLSFTIEPGRIYGFLGPNGAQIQYKNKNSKRKAHCLPQPVDKAMFTSM